MSLSKTGCGACLLDSTSPLAASLRRLPVRQLYGHPESTTPPPADGGGGVGQFCNKQFNVADPAGGQHQLIIGAAANPVLVDLLHRRSG